MIANSDESKSILNRFSEKNVLVIGDIMLDAYYWGKTERISPEAPVPIVEVNRKNFNPGGAGNVALNLAELGCNVALLAKLGTDSNGITLMNLLKNANIDISPLILIDDYKTPVKTRVIAQDQQVIRIDQETHHLNSKLIVNQLRENIENILIRYDGIIIADYNKGLFSVDIIQMILKKAKELAIPVYVDPKWDNFFEYNNVHFFKPNLAEFKKANDSDNSKRNFINDAEVMRNKLNADILLVTQGADGATIFSKDGYETIPTETQPVHDVSGAGDTVIATFALADLCGANPTESARIANIAASVVCAQVGVVPIKLADLQKLMK